MNQQRTVMLAVFVALGVTLIAGLIAIPAMEQSAQAGILKHRLDAAKALRGKILSALRDRLGGSPSGSGTGD